jgi:5-methyltetrahydrofolate--homocysteine methyltransferase
MERTYTNRKYLDALKEQVLIFDGAMGTNLQKMNLTAVEFGGEKTVGCNDYLVLSHPQAPLTVHRSFLEAGVDVIETCTFRSNRITLAEYGLADRVLEINRAAARLARKAADEFSTPDHPRFVAGSIGPSGKLPSMNDPELSNVSIDELADIFREQAAGLITGGVDLLLIETSQDILEVRAAIHGIQQAFLETGVFLPIQAQVTLDTTGRMLLGTDISAVLTILEGLPIDVIGLNCSTGPEHMREPIQILGSLSPLPVSCIPNAGLPLNVDGEAVYPLTPEEFASSMGEFVEKFHVNVVGGCCGTTPAHLHKLVERIHGHANLPRPIFQSALLASSIQAQPMQQEPRPFFIGERLNTQGSTKFKQIILDENYDAILSIARQQVNNGAHGLDLCVALTERSDEVESIKKAIKVLAPVMRIPLVIDSTEPEVMEAALKNYPGRCLLNSINLEAGEEKAGRILSLAKEYNAAVIALTIDEKGMAKTAERKLEIARRIHALAVEKFGLRSQDLVFDALTFTLATGDPEYARSALDTFEGIRLIKSNLPGVLTSLGVSNVSFGLDPRARGVLNSLMLYHSVQSGLDMAIVNPAQITPYPDLTDEERNLGEDLILNRNPDALQNLINHFQALPAGSGGAEQQQSELAGMDPRERLHFKILHRIKEGVDADIDEIVTPVESQERHTVAIDVLNTVLLPAMKEVGDRFGAGELILPFVLQSAEVMKASVTHLEQYLERKEGASKGRVVLATVYGDVHDIGKNLVKTILSNNGYEVIDLGKQVPAELIISKAVEVNADAIGLSALLVSTSRQMPAIVNELSLRKLNFPVLIGGAAINRRFGRRILQVEDGTFYPGGVFYCKDAFEGLSTMDRLSDQSDREKFINEILVESKLEIQKESSAKASAASTVIHSATPPAAFIPRPPSWGPRVVKKMPLEEVFEHLSLKELYRLSWGAKNAHGDAWKKMEEKFTLRLAEMKKEALRTGWIRPQGVYGYFPCQADGNDLVLFDSGSLAASIPVELTRFTFPRQSDQEHLSLADYFLPLGSASIDAVALQVVTVGREATRRVEELNAEGEITEAYFAHGLAVQVAEATANYLHAHIRRELGLATDQGKRYSWGYPAIPELADHQKVFDLLPVENELGMRLTSAFQLIPEQSTAAIIVHHPAASYFNVAAGRRE